MSSETPDDTASDGSGEWDPRAQYREIRRERDRLAEHVAVVSHDLRNHLGVATARLERAREGADCEDIETAISTLDRLGELIDDLSAHARQQRTVDEREPVPIGGVAESTWGTVATADATLEVTATGTVLADAGRLKCLFENCYRNAVDHAGPGVTVRVGDLEDGFYVADDGPGIPPDERERVFEPGYTTAERGSGIGLVVVSEVVDAHGWRLTVTESRDGGARFEIRDDDRAVRRDAAVEDRRGRGPRGPRPASRGPG